MTDNNVQNKDQILEKIEEMSQVLVAVSSGDLNARYQRDLSGDAMDVLGYMVNTTVEEIDRLVTRLQQKSIHLESVFDAISDAVFVLDSVRKITRINQASARLLKQDPSMLIGRMFQDVIIEGELKSSWLDRVYNGATVHNIEIAVIDSDGQKHPLLIDAAPLNDTNHRALGAVIIGKDQTQIHDLVRLLERTQG